MPRSSTQHLAVDTQLPGGRAREPADLQTLSGTGAQSQLTHSPGSSPVREAKLSNARLDISADCSQSKSRDSSGERQQVAVESADCDWRATTPASDSDNGRDLDQLLSQQQLWDAAWRAFEPRKAHQHLSTPDRLPSRSNRDAVQRELSPSSFPSLAARLFGVGSRSGQRKQRCASIRRPCRLLVS